MPRPSGVAIKNASVPACMARSSPCRTSILPIPRRCCFGSTASNIRSGIATGQFPSRPVENGADLHHILLCPSVPKAFFVSSSSISYISFNFSASRDLGSGSLNISSVSSDDVEPSGPFGCEGNSHCANPTTSSGEPACSGTSTATNVGLPSLILLKVLVARHWASSRPGSPVSDLECKRGGNMARERESLKASRAMQPSLKPSASVAGRI